MLAFGMESHRCERFVVSLVWVVPTIWLLRDLELLPAAAAAAGEEAVARMAEEGAALVAAPAAAAVLAARPRFQ